MEASWHDLNGKELLFACCPFILLLKLFRVEGEDCPSLSRREPVTLVLGKYFKLTNAWVRGP